MKNHLIILGLLFAALSSHSISHIGRGISSNLSLYQTQAPQQLRVLFPLEGDGLQLEGGQYFGSSAYGSDSGGVLTEQLALYEPGFLYPELDGKTRQEIEEQLRELGWTSTDTTVPCAIAFEESRNGLFHRILLWADHRGIVFIGTDRANLRRAITFMESKITLDNGACEWK